MTEDEFKKLIDIELQWLYYYSNKESKMKLNEESNIYDDLQLMKYSKRIVDLETRCIPCVLTSNEIIEKNHDISKIFKINSHRGENKYSPIETFIKIYPERKMEIIKKLKIKS
jgi:hypothetical protein